MSTRMPDVTVIVAVYNTRPYLAECLESVVTQTIGTDRLQIVAIDDGSTDGSGSELDDWAARWPGVMVVEHQQNSGSPAAPSNRALELATGRYVFFLGADDTLGPEALDRLVRTADELDADIVLGRLVGAGGRWVNQDIYKPGNRDDITLLNSALPWALSNTKLYRRSLIEEHGIRYPTDLRAGSDQRVTLRALTVARRVAVRSDYTFYYAIRRADSSNLTYGTPLSGMAHDAATVMDAAADLITDPAARHRVHHRHFSWEVSKLVGDRFSAAPAQEQNLAVQRTRKLAEAYLTEEIRAALTVNRRVAISLAQYGTADDVRAMLAHHAEHGRTPLVESGGRTYVAYPGFRDPAHKFPDEWFDAAESTTVPPAQAAPARVSLGPTSDGRPSLAVRWRTALEQRDGEPAPLLALGKRMIPTRRAGDEMAADVLLPDLIVARRPRLRLVGTYDGTTYDNPVTADLHSALRTVVRHGPRLHLIRIATDERGLTVAALPLTPVSVARKIVGRARKLAGRR